MIDDERRLEEVANMTDEICIHDLEEIRDYFMEQTGGCYPVCLDYAIAVLRVKNNRKEDKNEDSGK